MGKRNDNVNSGAALRRRPPFSASTADRHVLYELAVQNPEAELDFVSRTFAKLRGRPARRIREDFCGTANTSCEWVKRSAENIAVGLDLDEPTLRWSRQHKVSELTREQAARLTLLRRNVLTPGREGAGVDCVLAMNFSYWIFADRPTMLRYYRAVRASLARDGVFYLDHYGGWEAQKIQVERRRVRGFTYLWDQAAFNPITSEMSCRIHFEFPDGTRMRNAFRYDWRLWSVREITDLLIEAGFQKPTVYWEGDDGKGGGNGVFRPSTRGENCASFIAYIMAPR